MKRLTIALLFVGVLTYLFSLNYTAGSAEARGRIPQERKKLNKDQKKEEMEKVIKTEVEWKKQLTEIEYKVTREKATERPFTGELYYNTENGVYSCKCCGAELFTSEQKYDAGCGWPSFWDAIDKSKITEKKDFSFGMIRTEVLCAKCDAHLGHIFDDGPEPTGIRYCINSVSLNFEKKEQKK